ncbi:MAG TPA: hypothetical protein VNS58_20520 [Puia sp.]|nr:hypothetical protein [Puia sp.]
MKASLKIGIVSALLVSSTLVSKAQSTPSATSSKQEFRLSVGPEAGIPLGDLSNGYNWNFGGSIQADIPVIHNLYVTVNAGYDNFFVKKHQADVVDKNLQLIPVKAGLKYFPVGNIFYVQGEGGVSFLANKSDLGADKSAAFVYAPQVGVLLKLAPKNYIDLGVRFESTAAFYNGGNTNNFLGLRAAYAFGL